MIPRETPPTPTPALDAQRAKDVATLRALIAASSSRLFQQRTIAALVARTRRSTTTPWMLWLQNIAHDTGLRPVAGAIEELAVQFARGNL